MVTSPVIPPQHRGFFTDAQAEELISQFQLCDGDGSGAIDEREFHSLLTKLKLDVSPEEASDLVARIDVDGNGLVDFDELVGMVVKIKRGDTQFQKLRAFVDALDMTPVALLEREAAKFQMQVRYQLLEEKPGTKSTPPIFVMALTLQGKWIKGGNGELTIQAVGKTTRDAKFKAAHDALLKIKQLKPGLAYDIGEVPPTWQNWLFENLEAGSSPSKIMKKLQEKGFSPAQNAELMQRISTRASSLRLRQRRGRGKSKTTGKTSIPIYDEQGDSRQPDEPDVEDEDLAVKTPRGPLPKKRCNGLHPVWVHWSQQELARSIDGRLVLDELVSLGFESEKFPFVTQSFLKASYLNSQSNNEPQPLTPRSLKRQQRRPSAERTVSVSHSPDAAQSSLPVRPYCFWRCLEEGDLREIELFVYGGQELNVPQLDAATKLEMTPLQVVCKAGHAEIASFLLANGAAVDHRDAFHRTPLLLAARGGHKEICRLLLEKGAALLATDSLDNTPLHWAAFSGSSGVAHLLLEAYDEKLLVFLAELPRRRKTCYSQILKDAHAQVMHAKLRSNERRRFHMSWCWDALLYVYKTLFDGHEGTVPPPKPVFMTHVLQRYHDRFLEQRKLELLNDSDDSGEEDDEEDSEWDAGVRERKAAERVARREWIAFDEMAFCVDLSLRESWKNAVNKQGRTALHVACEQNLVCTHELMIQCLSETHGCDPEIRDCGGCTPMDLLLASKARPGSPRGDSDYERTILTERRARIDAEDVERERRRLELRRAKWQTEVEALSQNFQNLEVLEAAKKAVRSSSVSQATLVEVQGWEIYEEPWSRNRLFVNAASGFVQRQVPAKVVAFTRERLAWKEKLDLNAHFVEQNRDAPEWEVHRVNGSDVYFFFNRMTTACQWLPPSDPPLRTWKTKRIFAEQAHLDDCEDVEALKLAFSGTFTAPLRNDCVRGRPLSSDWRECSLVGVVFYWNEATDVVSIEKPPEALHGEAIRYGQVRVRARSEVIDELSKGWKRWYDAHSALNYYYDDDRGECVLDVDADRLFLKRVRKPKGKRLRDSQLTAEERAKRLEEHEWKQALTRARKRDVQQKEKLETAQKSDSQQQAQENEFTQDLLRLETSVTSEQYDEAQGRPLGYVDARFQREKEIYLENRRLDSMVSLNPMAVRSRHEIERAIEISQELDDQEREHANVEDRRVDGGNPQTNGSEPLAVRERRRVSRIVWKTHERVRRDLVICRWGCGMWFPRLQSLNIHEKNECPRRRMVCRLGCGLVREDQVWQKTIPDHEAPHMSNCDSRTVACPRVCGVFTPHVKLKHHMDELCVRRPIGDLRCRLGCGRVYTGGAHELLLLEQERVAHEQDECGLRKVQCTWPQCLGMILAKDRNDHRRSHLIASGVLSFLTAEIHEYKVPKGIKQLKIQAWGAGGGSGLLKGQTTGSGGGGAFIEGVCKVFPGETLYFAVGAGGNGGIYAKMTQNEAVSVETKVGVALGGAPGGGKGHSGNKESACGGGGGFTSVYRHSAFGIEYILIAAGGGGGGTCRNGGGGGGLQAPGLKNGDDLRVGRQGDAQKGGQAGECDPYNPICRFVGTDGGSLQGGDGAEFGGGGGGGLFGGGGGGFAPGIVGGGGGGSSFVNKPAFEPKTLVVCSGKAHEPGGLDRKPPRSVGTAYWDLVDGVVGEGGTGSPTHVARGNHGGIRIAKPGFFNDMHHHC